MPLRPNDSPGRGTQGSRSPSRNWLRGPAQRVWKVGLSAMGSREAKSGRPVLPCCVPFLGSPRTDGTQRLRQWGALQGFGDAGV